MAAAGNAGARAGAEGNAVSSANFTNMATRFVEESAEPAIQGFLEAPEQANGDGVVLAHGAGSNCQAKLLIGVTEALAAMGFTVLRFDLPFRVERPTGPPRPGAAEKDRTGIRRAADLLKAKIRGRLFLGGHSYGGRQASMLAAEEPGVAADGDDRHGRERAADQGPDRSGHRRR